MVVKKVNLEKVCGITSTIPENIYQEVAFAGKSNVGKSSLINTLLNRNGMARISSQPGKTQTINFYNVNDGMYLVDLPGYGYAQANEEIKAQWGVMIENYLHTSKMLKAVFLLIDIRHEPSENDQLMYEWMVSQGFAPIIIATKCDKLKKDQISASVSVIRQVLNTVPDTIIIPFSSETKEGKAGVWQLIEQLLFPEGVPESMISRKEKEELERQRKAASGDTDAPKKKERWKKSGHPEAKKTAKKKEQKKEEHIEQNKKDMQKARKQQSGKQASGKQQSGKQTSGKQQSGNQMSGKQQSGKQPQKLQKQEKAGGNRN